MHPMRAILTLAAAFLVSTASGVAAEEGDFFAFGRFPNLAILEMPDRYLDDVPLTDRGRFLVLLSQCTQTLRPEDSLCATSAPKF